MRSATILFPLALTGALLADTLTLRGGRVVNGTYLGGSARQIRMEVGNQIETFDVSDVAKLEFTAAAPVPAPAPARSESNVFRPAPAAPAKAATVAGEIPAGRVITVRMIDGVDSERNQVGETFQASVDEPVTLNDQVLIPRGADVTVKLVDDKESGKITGRAELTLMLVSAKINGKEVPLDSQSVTQASESRAGQSGKVIGGTAALGAIIGAIGGGGRGAAIGAASGAAAGTAIQVLTKGQKVRIPSETRLSFTLANTVKL